MTHVVGIDLGGTKTLVASFDGDGRPIGREHLHTHADRGPDAVLDAVVATVQGLETRHGRAEAIGCGFAGLVDVECGTIDSSVILPGFAGAPMARILEARLQRPVRLENDATAAGYGEFVASGRRTDLDLLVLTVGTGIGGAIVLRGKVVRGASGVAGEFGNMTIDWNGAEHDCGNRGCLNTLASGTAILAHARRRAAELGEAHGDGRRPRCLRDVAVAAARGEGWAVDAIDRGARALGAGIANLVMAFNPHRIALMGGVLGLGEQWRAAVVDEALRRSFPRAAQALTVDLCRLGELTGAFGAAMLTQEAVLR